MPSVTVGLYVCKGSTTFTELLGFDEDDLPPSPSPHIKLLWTNGRDGHHF
eukprot:COSAG02_NODE_744_length_17752_cov_56.794992_6_plen_50_part_00